MRRLLNARWKAVVAAVTAAALAALSVVALLSSGPSPETSHDLEREFRALDARYQTATQEFVDAAKALKTDDLVSHRMRYYTNPLGDVENYLHSQKGGGTTKYTKPEDRKK